MKQTDLENLESQNKHGLLTNGRSSKRKSRQTCTGQGALPQQTIFYSFDVFFIQNNC